MPRTITCMGGILRGGPDAFSSGVGERQLRLGGGGEGAVRGSDPGGWSRFAPHSGVNRFHAFLERRPESPTPHSPSLQAHAVTATRTTQTPPAPATPTLRATTTPQTRRTT